MTETASTQVTWVEHEIDIGSLRLCVRRTERELPALVMAHGITDSADCWSRLAGRLAARIPWDVICYSARGHGRSARSADYGFVRHLDDLVGLCSGLSLDRPILVGHSMGGPHVVAAAPVVGARAAIVLDPHWPEDPEDSTTYDVGRWRADVAREQSMSLAALIEAGRATHPGWHDVDLRAWAEAKQQVDPDVTSWVESHAQINAWRERLSEVDAPVLLVTADPSIDPDVTVTDIVAHQAMAAHRDLTRVHIPGTGHSLHRDDHHAVATALEQYLGHL